MNLLIVESPTKAKTLSRFLGKDFSVEATMGHVKDLPKSELGIDIKNNFKPDYVLVPKREETIESIKRKAKNVKQIYLATDPDREGEAIASHVKETINGKKTIRIVFHEITKEAVEEAIKNPREIDKNLVYAQIGRRVLDRLVGYKLSPLLWRKVRRGLSAGRVQTVAVRLIVEREKEIEKFKPEEYWEIYCKVKSKSGEFTVQLIKIREKKAEIGNGQEAKKIVKDLEKADYKVFDVQQKEVVKNPYPPFTTSTMTQAGARIFGWSAKRTMSIAQKLYEKGLITYHRTDSTNIAGTAIQKVRDFIQKEYGEKYLPPSPRFYKTTSKVAQEAHEAIRPTGLNYKFQITNSKFVRDEETLYNLIWKRFIACQMTASIYNETTIDVIANKPINYLLRASGQIMKFDGWRKVIPKGKELEEAMVQLPKVEKDEKLHLIKVDPLQKFTEPPARYNEASLIKTLEKLGIGRPSTYAPIITTIQVRQYVEKDEGKFVPTPVGVAVNDFLLNNFSDIFEYAFTAQMEDGLDKIANGEQKWVKEIRKFWTPFEKKLNQVGKKSKRVKIETEKLGRKCPECKKGELVVRIGRFGKFISCSRFPDCRFTDKFVEKAGFKCPKCKIGDAIIKKTSKGRKFFGCSRYPECQWASWRNPKKENSK
jgi:DNA topoisomerase-1